MNLYRKLLGRTKNSLAKSLAGTGNALPKEAWQAFEQLKITYAYCQEMGDTQCMKLISKELAQLVRDYPELAPRAQPIMKAFPDTSARARPVKLIN